MTDNNIKIINNATVEVAKKFLEEGYLLVGNADRAYALPVHDHIRKQALNTLVHECNNICIYKGTRVCSTSSSGYTMYFHTVIRGLLLVVSEYFDFSKHQWVFGNTRIIQVEADEMDVDDEEEENIKYSIDPCIEDAIDWYMDLWDNK